MKHSIKILSWNVNGIRAQITKNFYAKVKELNADILCIQETKAQHDNMPNISGELPEYKMFINAAVQKGYSGTAILTKLMPLNHTLNIGVEKHDQEGRVICLEFASFYLVNVYVPNSGQELKRLDYRREWDEAFVHYLSLLEAKKPVIVTGDLNVAHEPIDLARPKENYNKVAGYTQTEIDGFKKYLDIGLKDSYRVLYKDRIQYTYWSQRFRARENNVGWRIDYFMVSGKIMDKVKDAVVLDQVMGSDHCPVGIELEI
jgi:exodeoxyribonuclease III